MTHSRWLIPIALVVALIQIAVLSWSIFSRAAILRDGTEILVRVEPIDPRDLFRGDYVILTYAFSRLPRTLLEGSIDSIPEDMKATAHVRLRKGADGIWDAVKMTLGAPFADPPGTDEVDLRGQTRYLWSNVERDIFVDYGIERYYVPEGEGRDIEDGLRERTLNVVAAVAADGTVAIKALYDGDTLLYEEPYY